jgi:hypothetical protein
MARVSADARQHSAQDDHPTACHWRVVNCHYPDIHEGPLQCVLLLYLAYCCSRGHGDANFEIPVGVNSILLTITGFVVSLGLSFRSSTAYERYAEGRKYWAQLITSSQALGRIFWVHASEREGAQGEKDLLAKMSASAVF